MSETVEIDLPEVRRIAASLSQAAADLQKQRPDLLSRLAKGAEVRPVEKVVDNVKVTIGAPAYEHTGSRAGDLIAEKLKSCGDSFTAVEDGLRALASVMSAMATALENGDGVSAADLQTAVSDLYCVALVNDGEAPESVDWFGLESA